jgi:protein-tyrosine-phosphatase
MAEYLFKEMNKGANLQISSRGLSAYGSTSFSRSRLLEVSEEACKAVRGLHPDSQIFVHEPKSLKMKDLLEFHWIITMEEKHREDILECKEYIPDLERRVLALKEVAVEEQDEYDISDPIGGQIYSYEYSSRYPERGSDLLKDLRKTVPSSPSTTQTNHLSPPSSPKKDYNQRYIECRDEIAKYLQMIVQNKIDIEEIIKRRKIRAKKSKSLAPGKITGFAEWTPGGKKRRKVPKHNWRTEPGEIDTGGNLDSGLSCWDEG